MHRRREGKRHVVKTDEKALGVGLKTKFLIISGLAATVVTAIVALVLMAPSKVSRGDLRPAGDTMRIGNHFATLVLETEFSGFGRRRSSTSRMGAHLMLMPVEDPRKYEEVEIASGLNDLELRNNAKLFGYDGKHLWLAGKSLFGVQVATRQRIDLGALSSANPELSRLWLEEAKYYKMNEAGDRLVVTVADGRKFLVAPDSLKVTPYVDEKLPAPRTAEESRRQWADYHEKMSMFGIGPQKFFWSGEMVTDQEWFGLFTAEKAEEMRTSWSSPGRIMSEDGKRVGLYRVQLETLERGSRVTGLTQVGTDTYLNAGFLRSAKAARALRLRDPAGYVVMHRFRLGEQGTLMLTRIDMQGKKLWEFDTGILNVDQILPAEDYLGIVDQLGTIHSVKLADGSMLLQGLK